MLSSEVSLRLQSTGVIKRGDKELQSSKEGFFFYTLEIFSEIDLHCTCKVCIWRTAEQQEGS